MTRQRIVYEVSDEEILELAQKVVKASPKSRFSFVDVVNAIREREQPKHEGRVRVKAKGGISVQRRVDQMAEEGHFVAARSRGSYRIAKKTKGKGLEYKKLDADSVDILHDGKSIGEIARVEGDFIHGSSRQRTKVYDVNLDTKNVNPPDTFKKIADAKRWVKSNLKAIVADLVEDVGMDIREFLAERRDEWYGRATAHKRGNEITEASLNGILKKLAGSSDLFGMKDFKPTGKKASGVKVGDSYLIVDGYHDATVQVVDLNLIKDPESDEVGVVTVQLDTKGKPVPGTYGIVPPNQLKKSSRVTEARDVKKAMAQAAKRLKRGDASPLKEGLQEARSPEAVIRSLAVTIDEMETDPGYRKKQPIKGQSADAYLGNLAAHSKEVKALDQAVSRSIHVTRSDMQADMDRRGQIAVRDFASYIQNLKADLARLKKKGMKESIRVEASLFESVLFEAGVPKVGDRVKVLGETHKVQDVNTSDFDQKVLLVKLGEGSRVETYGYHLGEKKWLKPIEVTAMRTQAHDRVADEGGEEEAEGEEQQEARRMAEESDPNVMKLIHAHKRAGKAMARALGAKSTFGDGWATNADIRVGKGGSSLYLTVGGNEIPRDGTYLIHIKLDGGMGDNPAFSPSVNGPLKKAGKELARLGSGLPMVSDRNLARVAVEVTPAQLDKAIKALPAIAMRFAKGVAEVAKEMARESAGVMENTTTGYLHRAAEDIGRARKLEESILAGVPLRK